MEIHVFTHLVICQRVPLVDRRLRVYLVFLKTCQLIHHILNINVGYLSGIIITMISIQGLSKLHHLITG